MSRLGIKPVLITDNIEVSIDDNRNISIKGPKGSININLPYELSAQVNGNKISIIIKEKKPQSSALQGLFRTLVMNAVYGVSKLWEKTLEVHGVGYRVSMQGTSIIANVGYSHPVILTPPKDVVVQVKGKKIIVSGVDKQRVGEVAANIRKIRKPDRYKGKGIRYENEIVKLKPGKKAKAA